MTDTPAGPELAPARPYPVLPEPAALPDRRAQPDTHPATVSVLVEGWPDDVERCVAALLAHTAADVRVQLLEVGDRDGAGAAVHRIASAASDRVEAWHVATSPGWARARTALLWADTAAVHVWCDPAVVLEGDAVGPLVAAAGQPGVAAAGWRGVEVDLADDWRSVRDAPAGEVDALLGYLLAVRRPAALAAGGPDPRARFYRNADLEFSFQLRAAGAGRLVVPAGPLPVRLERHRGYHDTDPAVRDRESRRNYNRFLDRFRGRTDLLAPR